MKMQSAKTIQKRQGIIQKYIKPRKLSSDGILHFWLNASQNSQCFLYSAFFIRHSTFCFIYSAYWFCIRCLIQILRIIRRASFVDSHNSACSVKLACPFTNQSNMESALDPHDTMLCTNKSIKIVKFFNHASYFNQTPYKLLDFVSNFAKMLQTQAVVFLMQGADFHFNVKLFQEKSGIYQIFRQVILNNDKNICLAKIRVFIQQR